MQKNMERPGIEPGTTSMLKRYYTIKPSPHSQINRTKSVIYTIRPSDDAKSGLKKYNFTSHNQSSLPDLSMAMYVSNEDEHIYTHSAACMRGRTGRTYGARHHRQLAPEELRIGDT